MTELNTGDSFPGDTTFSYVPYVPENDAITSCGIPISYDTSKGILPPSQKLLLTFISPFIPYQTKTDCPPSPKPPLGSSSPVLILTGHLPHRVG
jgi:hypothetical protein